MAEEGGHGGATFKETHVPVVFLRSKDETYFEEHAQPTFKIQQVDLVPTLSTLFGLPIPANSIGVSFVHQLETTPGASKNHDLWSLLQNGNQLRYLLLHGGRSIDQNVIGKCTSMS